MPQDSAILPMYNWEHSRHAARPPQYALFPERGSTFKSAPCQYFMTAIVKLAWFVKFRYLSRLFFNFFNQHSVQFSLKCPRVSSRAWGHRSLADRRALITSRPLLCTSPYKTQATAYQRSTRKLPCKKKPPEMSIACLGQWIIAQSAKGNLARHQRPLKCVPC